MRTSTILTLVQSLVRQGAKPITVTLDTAPRVKRNCPPDLVPARKVQRLNCFLNFNYQRSVNRQRVREAKPNTFKVEPTWFVHSAIPAVVIGRKTGKPHLQLKLERVVSCEYFNSSGQPIDVSKLKPYLYGNTKPIKQGLTKPVLTLVPAFQSIRSIRANHKQTQ